MEEQKAEDQGAAALVLGQDALSEVTQICPSLKLRVFVEDTTALVKGRNVEVAEMAKKGGEKTERRSGERRSQAVSQDDCVLWPTDQHLSSIHRAEIRTLYELSKTVPAFHLHESVGRVPPRSLSYFILLLVTRFLLNLENFRTDVRLRCSLNHRIPASKPLAWYSTALCGSLEAFGSTSEPFGHRPM